MNPGHVLDGTTLEVRNVPRAQDKLGVSAEEAARIAADAALQAQLDALPAVSVPTSLPYTFTNATPLRTIDVSTATLTDALNALAALTADLRTAGILPPL